MVPVLTIEPGAVDLMTEAQLVDGERYLIQNGSNNYAEILLEDRTDVADATTAVHSYLLEDKTDIGVLVQAANPPVAILQRPYVKGLLRFSLMPT